MRKISIRKAKTCIRLATKMRLKTFLLALFGTFVFASFIDATSDEGVHSGRIPARRKISPGSRKAIREEVLHSIDQPSNDLPLPLALEDLKPKHKKLYRRAHKQDYDFAQFGKPCMSFTVEELDIFLSALHQMIEPHEGQPTSPRMSPKEKGEILEKLFNRSRVICDFRNMLTCQKHAKTCACAHESFGANRNGICQINNGHPCELPYKTLTKYGILLTPASNPLKCIHENAECVADSFEAQFGAVTSPTRKICKCRTGYTGSTCARRGTPKVDKKLEKEVIASARASTRHMGRSFGAQDEKTSSSVNSPVEGTKQPERKLWDDDDGTGSSTAAYALHPVEIKTKLMEMMKERGGYGTENDQETFAKQLVKNLEQDTDKEEMVTHELQLRTLARLQHGEKCDPKKQVMLDNPPTETGGDGQGWMDPPPDDIKSWQLGLLQGQTPLCNVYRHFHCEEKTETCQCRPGLVLDPMSNGTSCAIPPGHNCGPDFETVLQFDPLRDRKRFSEMATPKCIANTGCKHHPLFFQKKCWCEEGQNCSQGIDEAEFEKVSSGIHLRFTLGLKDSCDPALHKRVLSYSTEKGEDTGTVKRLALFQEILQNPETRLCDITNYLNCSETSRKCECWSQLEPKVRVGEGEDNGTGAACSAMSMASCGRTFEYGKFMYPLGSQLWEVERTFEASFEPECIPAATCAGGDDFVWAGRCMCQDKSKTGETCSDPKSILADGFKSRQIPKDDQEEMTMIHVFFDINRQTHLMEGLMTLGNNDKCDPEIGLRLDRLVKFWKGIASSKESLSEHRSLPHFVAATKLTKYLVSTTQGSSAALCNVTLGLRCVYPSRKCECPRGTRLVDGRCYLDVNEICDPRPAASWVPSCINTTSCVLVRTRHGQVQHECKMCQPGSRCGEEEEDEEYDDDPNHIWSIYNRPKIQGRKFESPLPDAESALSVGNGNSPAPIEEAMKKCQQPQRIAFSSRASGLDVPDAISADSSTKKELSDKQKATFRKQTELMLEEILTYRKLSYGEPCRNSDEDKLAEVFPDLPMYNLSFVPTTTEIVHTIISRLHWKGISFCDRKKYLTCSEIGRCNCSEECGYVSGNSTGVCELDEDFKHCSVLNESHIPIPTDGMCPPFPFFKCRSVTNCTRLGVDLLEICVDKEDKLKSIFETGAFGRQSQAAEEESSEASRNVLKIANMILFTSILFVQVYSFIIFSMYPTV